MVDQVWEPGLAWVEVVPGGSGEKGKRTRKKSLLPEGVETGLCAEVFGLLARGEHAVDALAHGVIGEPGVGEGLAQFFDLWGESRDVHRSDLDGWAAVLRGGT